MHTMKQTLLRATGLLLIFTLLCGGIYTLAVTGLAQLLFPEKANGSILQVEGKLYGSTLLGQQYTDDAHLWGRIMKLDTKTFADEQGRPMLYAVPTNLSPASPEYEALVEERVVKLRAAHPDQGDTPIPVDLVTCSGSGLDPHISVAAARYQLGRLAAHTDYTQEQLEQLVEQYTTGRFLGIFGEPTVNVLKVNLALDGILK